MNEYRILWIRRSWVGLAHLDSGHRLGCRVSLASRLVEGEIVRFAEGGPEDPNCLRPVASSRIDPGYAPGRWPGLETYTLPELDAALAPYHGLTQPVTEDVEERLYSRVTLSESRSVATRVKACRRIIEENPLFLDAYHALGEIEWTRGRKEKARKYLETAWKIARLALPETFSGTFDGRNGQNLPVFWAGTSYAKVLAQFGREDEALDILDFLFRIDRPGGWCTEGIALPMLLRARRRDAVRRVVESGEDLGPGEFVRALLFFEDGRDEDATRAVCRGVVSSPLALETLLAPGKEPLVVPLQIGREHYAYLASLHASLTLPAWRDRGLLQRLEALTQLPVFSSALGRAVRLAREHDLGAECILGWDPREDFEEFFPDTVIEATVRSAMRG